MAEVIAAVGQRCNDDAFQRVIYTESHDRVANKPDAGALGDRRGDPGWLYAQKRSTVGGDLVLTSPGIPMIFQGQEFLEAAWFGDDVPLDWAQNQQFHGVVRLYRDLIMLRRNATGVTRVSLVTTRGCSTATGAQHAGLSPLGRRWPARLDRRAHQPRTRPSKDCRCGCPAGRWTLASTPTLGSTANASATARHTTSTPSSEAGFGIVRTSRSRAYSVLIYPRTEPRLPASVGGAKRGRRTLAPACCSLSTAGIRRVGICGEVGLRRGRGRGYRSR